MPTPAYLNVDIINPSTGNNVIVNNAEMRGFGSGMRSLTIGVNQKALSSISADLVHLGTDIFPLGVSGNPQTVAIGSSIGDLGTNTTCSQSIFIGTKIARNIDNSFDNVFIGYKSAENAGGSFIGNTFVGSQSGLALTTGSNNTFLGVSAGSNVTTGGNNIVIGNGATASTATSSNTITLGNSSITTLRCAVTSITSLSDARDKDEITELSAGLDFINDIKPVSFTWKDRNEEGKQGIKDSGFTAQNLKEVQEKYNLVEEMKLVCEDNPEKLEASYGRLMPILVKAIQELSDKVEELQTKKK